MLRHSPASSMLTARFSEKLKLFSTCEFDGITRENSIYIQNCVNIYFGVFFFHAEKCFRLVFQEENLIRWEFAVYAHFFPRKQFTQRRSVMNVHALSIEPEFNFANTTHFRGCWHSCAGLRELTKRYWCCKRWLISQINWFYVVKLSAWNQFYSFYIGFW